MKKILSLFLVMTVLCTFLTGCGALFPKADDGLPTVMSVGDSKVSLQEYNYTFYANYAEFCSTYSQYLSYFGLGDKTTLKSQPCTVSEEHETWADFFMAQTEEMLTQVYTFYNAAKADKMELNASYSQDLEAYMLEVEEVAEREKQSADEFLSANYGSGMTVDLYREFLARRLLATQYCDEKLAQIEYSDDRYEDYYQKNKLALDKVTFRVFTVTEDYLPADTSKDDEDTVDAAVKAYAELFAKDLTTEEQFIQRALAYAPEEEKADFENESATLVFNYGPEKFAEGDMKTWLFDSSRQKGDVAVHKTGEGAYTVCYFLSCGRDEYPLASMRHLLLLVGDGKGYTDEEVKVKIQNLYDGWVAAGAKEEDFSVLATENTQDDASVSTGGLYELFSKGTMASPIDNWIYAEGRKQGDSEIIKTTYGYHIVLFLGYGEIAWKNACYDVFQSEDYTALYESLLPQNEVTFEENYKDTVANG